MDLGNSMMRKCAFIGALFLASGLCHAADGASREVKILRNLAVREHPRWHS